MAVGGLASGRDTPEIRQSRLSLQTSGESIVENGEFVFQFNNTSEGDDQEEHLSIDMIE
jgi:hydroxymethylpyrimidine pyrophosphatase-like HAD family hydrolase